MDLVPGDAEAVQATADLLAQFRQTLSRVGSGLRGLEHSDWTGQASDAFHSFYDEEPKRRTTCADAFHGAAQALTSYTQTDLGAGAGASGHLGGGGARANRRASLRGIPTRGAQNLDRDEYPPAVFSEGGLGASGKYVNDSDNRGAGNSMKNQIKGLDNGEHVTMVTGWPRPSTHAHPTISPRSPHAPATPWGHPPPWNWTAPTAPTASSPRY